MATELKISISGPYPKCGKCGNDMVPNYAPY